MEAQRKAGQAMRWINGLYDWIGAAVFALICFGGLFVFLIRVVGVDGNSMEPTLKNGERLVVTAFYGKAGRGDVVIVDRTDASPLVKRVIAVGGDRIGIDPNTFQVVLNGRPLEEDYTQGKTLPRDFGTGSRRIPEGYVVVMGDNRENSHDSRSADIGLISEDRIFGRVLFRFYPLYKAGWIE